MLDRSDNVIYLLVDFAIVHHARIGSFGLDFSCSSRYLNGFRHHALRIVNLIPDLLLILCRHCLASYGGSRKQRSSVAGGIKRILAVHRRPASWFDAENAEVHRIALRRDNTILTNYTVLLTTGYYLACQQ